MKDLRVVSVLAVGMLFSILLGFGQPALAQAPIELKFGTGTTSTDALGIFNKMWMKQVEDGTNGRVKMTWLGDAVIAPSTKTYDLLVAGTYDVGEAGTGNKPGAFPLFDAAQLPFVAPEMIPYAMALQTLLEDKDVAAQFSDIKILFMQPKLASQIFTRKKPIRSANDFKGLRVAVTSGEHAELMKVLGAVPVRMANAEVYSSVERGILDGALFHANLAYGYKMGEICDYVTLINISRSCGYHGMNLKRWNSLPGDIQKAILDISGMNGSVALAKHMAAAEGVMMKELTSSGKLKVLELSKEEQDKLVRVVTPMRDEWVKKMESQGKPGKRVLDTFMQLQKKFAEAGK
ncbi:MAG: TRAP transporter substrate-binding protein DctP [Syntrophaceae bacterium]|nr:TRAP transporter substrate-binding protein DctP [Syntrophaceae bacterium]